MSFTSGTVKTVVHGSFRGGSARAPSGSMRSPFEVVFEVSGGHARPSKISVFPPPGGVPFHGVTGKFVASRKPLVEVACSELSKHFLVHPGANLTNFALKGCVEGNLLSGVFERGFKRLIWVHEPRSPSKHSTGVLNMRLVRDLTSKNENYRSFPARGGVAMLCS